MDQLKNSKWCEYKGHKTANGNNEDKWTMEHDSNCIDLFESISIFELHQNTRSFPQALHGAQANGIET